MTYTVQKGDTLYGISKQFGIGVDDLMSENHLSSTNLVIGSVLVIPRYGSLMNYQVQKGDTLYSISKKYNISVAELSLLNNLTSSILKVGQIINIPIGDTVDDFNIYEVLPGDTLYSIAKKYDTTIDSLIHINDLKDTLLSVGQIIKIPSTSINVSEEKNFYVVQEGDTLYSIAKKFHISVSELVLNNQLTSNTLSIGQVLMVQPLYENDVDVGSSCYGDSYQEIKYVTYTVQKGDNLYSIARKYGVSVDAILRLNQLSSPNLSIGQVLKIKEDY